MIEVNNTEYDVVLLDTNIIQCMMVEGKDALYMLEKFYGCEKKYAFGISCYSIFELKPKQDLFNKMIEFFQDIPCIIFYPFPAIFKHQLNNTNEKLNITNDFSYICSPVAENGFKSFVTGMYSNGSKLIEESITQLGEHVEEWEEVRNTLDEKKSISILDYKRKEEKNQIQIILNSFNLDENLKIEENQQKIISARIMAYSKFERIYNTKKIIVRNDIMDIMISSLSPYVEVIVTEASQAEVLKKAKKFINEIKNIEIYKYSKSQNKPFGITKLN